MEQINDYPNNSKHLKRAFIGMLTILAIGCSTPPEEMTSAERAEDAKELDEAKNTTVEALGASFILALKENNYQHIEAFLPVKEDIENIVVKFDGTDEKKKAILAGSEENTKKIRENTREAFTNIREKGSKAGISWDEAEFVRTDYHLTPRNGLQYAELDIRFSYKGLEYGITISECINTDNGWLIFDKPKWKG